MEKYKILKYFIWGDLILEKGQVILAKPHNPPENNYAQPASMISIEHYPNKNQIVSTRTIESKIFLKQIIKY